jgi:hypothetical protein
VTVKPAAVEIIKTKEANPIDKKAEKPIEK